MGREAIKDLVVVPFQPTDQSIELIVQVLVDDGVI